MHYDLQHLQRHLEGQWQAAGRRIKWEQGPTDQLHPDFRVLEFGPGDKHDCWIYSTLGMSLGRADDAIELHLFAPGQNLNLVELLVAAAAYHRTAAPLSLHHTVNLGRPWLPGSACDHAYVSQPYLDGLELELFRVEGGAVSNYWLLPITESERDFKVQMGWQELEDMFEVSGLDFLDPQRPACV
ncbi:suppressor of fused domain protein [Hymenobacter sp. 15J16-1T3B]|uniref:suppressor of fused domain protein n=1 Tax=Hymenobacter sp. 15J16-1T3B TaxID=2886941 RepID=UPI001D11C82C|nr:suppressor of fused domain protein [Hymenobacter sp. 15J16-1T3B]MCC3157181.1 suppressor of fused domain protein [Hymenobacter sp. 15J16-1T3B]